MLMRLGIIGPGLIWQKKHRAALAKLASAFSITAFCASSERRKAETLLDFPAAICSRPISRRSSQRVAISTRWSC